MGRATVCLLNFSCVALLYVLNFIEHFISSRMLSLPLEIMKELYGKLQRYFDFNRQDVIFQSILRSILLLLSGAFLGAFIRDLSGTPGKFNLLYFSIVVIATATFIYLEVRRLRKEKNFPVTILDHLTASADLEEFKKKYNRKVKIDTYVDRSIQSLNANTCPVLYLAPENQLCHQDLQAGLNNVIKDFVDKPHYFLDLDKSKFTVGIYLNQVYDPASPPSTLETEEKLFIFRDDLSLVGLLPQELFDLATEHEEKFNLQTAIIECFNFSKYICRKIIVAGKSIRLICSPIPNVCENCPADGVIYCAYEGDDSCPTDIESILLIQGRILSNWISKFNDCVYREKISNQPKLHEHKKIDIPDDVKDKLSTVIMTRPESKT